MVGEGRDILEKRVLNLL